MMFIEKERKDMATIYDFLINYLKEPKGIEEKPIFSWKCEGFVQESFRITVAEENGIELWDSKLVYDRKHFCIEYEGKMLPQLKKCIVVLTCNETVVASSSFLTGCKKLDSLSQWIGFKDVPRYHLETFVVTGSSLTHSIDKSQEGWAEAVYLQKEFNLKKTIATAYLAICGVGFFQCQINEVKVGDRILQPAQTDYHKRALYNVFDVKDLLVSGNNMLQIALGNGRQVKAYGYDPNPRMIALLEVMYTDGTVQDIVSDEKWLVSCGPIKNNSIYEGVRYDARDEVIDWSKARQANLVEGYPLQPELLPPIRKTGEIAPVSISLNKQENWIVDFGQNSSGYVVLSIAHATVGKEIHLQFSELLQEDGSLLTATNRNAHTEDIYICKGTEKETFIPEFTYHGFRYAEIINYPGILQKDNVKKVVLHSDLTANGDFYCSNELLNKIHRNIRWSQRSNVMGIPTDCPQREERMGWLGDVQLVSRQAVYEFDMAAFYRKFLDDIRVSQTEKGEISDVTPPYWPLYPADPAWGSAYATLLWRLYEEYGDTQSLAKHYDSLKRYVDYLYKNSNDGILENFGKYGDWCPPASTFPKRTPISLTSTWFMVKDTLVFSRIATLLKKEEDAATYTKRYSNLVLAFNKKFDKKGKYLANWMSPTDNHPSMTSQILPLYLGLVPKDEEQKAVEYLVSEIIVRFDYHVDCGIVGLSYLYPVLLRYGYDDIAYKLMSKDTYPSFGYMVRNDATTLWERWEYLAGMGMNSHNHIMYGAPNAWFYQGLCGVRRHGDKWIIKPYFPKDMDTARSDFFVKEGKILIEWKRKSDKIVIVRWRLPLELQADFIPPEGWVSEGKTVLDKEGYCQVSCKKNS